MYRLLCSGRVEQRLSCASQSAVQVGALTVLELYSRDCTYLAKSLILFLNTVVTCYLNDQ